MRVHCFHVQGNGLHFTTFTKKEREVYMREGNLINNPLKKKIENSMESEQE